MKRVTLTVAKGFVGKLCGTARICFHVIASLELMLLCFVVHSSCLLSKRTISLIYVIEVMQSLLGMCHIWDSVIDIQYQFSDCVVV